jgi:hypothetical protein
MTLEFHWCIATNRSTVPNRLSCEHDGNNEAHSGHSQRPAAFFMPENFRSVCGIFPLLAASTSGNASEDICFNLTRFSERPTPCK